MPSVFISYSYDRADPSHEKTEGLAASLLRDGIIVYFDENRAAEDRGTPWTFWMEEKLRVADFVLMICTKAYRDKSRLEGPAHEGQGVAWEINMIYNHLKANKLKTERVIPAVFAGADLPFIPDPLQNASRHILDSEENYGKLYAVLTGQRLTEFPTPGPMVKQNARVVTPLFGPPLQLRLEGASSEETQRAGAGAYEVEQKAMRMAKLIEPPLERAVWMTEARQVDPRLDRHQGDLRAMAQELSGSEGGRVQLAALLIRGAERAKVGDRMRGEIRANGSPLANAYAKADEMVRGLRSFDDPCYVMYTEFALEDNRLRPAGVWFYSHGEEPPKVVQRAEESTTFPKAGGAVYRHLKSTGLAAATVHVVAPLGAILNPGADVLAMDDSDFHVVFRSDHHVRLRANGSDEGEKASHRFRQRLSTLKGRVAGKKRKICWFDATEPNIGAHLDACNVDLPAFRTGGAADAETQLKRLLDAAVPFALVTRRTVDPKADESRLAKALSRKAFADLPAAVKRGRTGQATCVLSHLSLIWDDRELTGAYE